MHARYTRLALSLGLLAIAAPTTAAAAGWVQAPRHCYAKVWDRALFGSGAYTAEGLRDMQDVPRYQDHLFNIYAECGVHPWVTVVLALAPAGYASAGDRDTFYIGPLSAGVRVGLLREGPLRLAASARYGFNPPVGDGVLFDAPIEAADGTTARAYYIPAVENHLGELQLELGRSFGLGSVPAYVAAALGARLNSNAGIDPMLIALLQLGATFVERLALDLHFVLVEPFFEPVTVTNVAGAGQTRYLGFGLTVSYWFIDALAVFANMEGVFYAESNAATPSFSFGLESRFSL